MSGFYGPPAPPASASQEGSGSQRWFRFDGTFSFGNLLIVAGLLSTSYAGWIRTTERMDRALSDIAGLQRTVATQAESAARSLAEQAQANREQLKENAERFQNIILGLQTTMAENLRRLEERVNKMEGSLDARRANTDQRLDALNGLAQQNRADLASLLRSSGISLPGSPGIRQR